MCWQGIDGVSSSALAAVNKLFSLILNDREAFRAFNLSVVGSSVYCCGLEPRSSEFSVELVPRTDLRILRSVWRLREPNRVDDFLGRGVL
jgi:hypothetical protein